MTGTYNMYRWEYPNKMAFIMRFPEHCIPGNILQTVMDKDTLYILSNMAMTTINIKTLKINQYTLLNAFQRGVIMININGGIHAMFGEETQHSIWNKVRKTMDIIPDKLEYTLQKMDDIDDASMIYCRHRNIAILFGGQNMNFIFIYYAETGHWKKLKHIKCRNATTKYVALTSDEYYVIISDKYGTLECLDTSHPNPDRWRLWRTRLLTQPDINKVFTIWDNVKTLQLVSGYMRRNNIFIPTAIQNIIASNAIQETIHFINTSGQHSVLNMDLFLCSLFS